MPPFTATWVSATALDRDDLVERHHRAADDAAAGLHDELRVRVEMGVERLHGGARRSRRSRARARPAGTRSRGRRRGRRRGSGRARRSPRRPGEAVEIEQLRADVHVQAEQLEPGDWLPSDRAVPAPARARRRTWPPGCRCPSRRGSRPGTAGLTRSSTRCVAVGEPLQAVDVIAVVDHDHPDAGIQRVLNVEIALGVAVQQDVLGVEPGRERDRQLAGGGDVAAQPLLGEDARHRRARERLAGEVHVGAGVAAAERVQVLASGLPQPRLVDHEGGRAELGGHVGERHATDRQPAVSRFRGPREDVEYAHRGRVFHCRVCVSAATMGFIVARAPARSGRGEGRQGVRRRCGASAPSGWPGRMRSR